MITFKIIKGAQGYKQAAEFRHSILTYECGFADSYDKYDDIAFHIVGYESGNIISYARLYKIRDYCFAIDKMAVRKEDRLQYVGDTMIRAFEDRAVSEVGAVIYIDAPENSWEFFEHEDYIQCGEIYSNDGIKYRKMKRDLTKIRKCRGCKSE